MQRFTHYFEFNLIGFFCCTRTIPVELSKYRVCKNLGGHTRLPATATWMDYRVWRSIFPKEMSAVKLSSSIRNEKELKSLTVGGMKTDPLAWTNYRTWWKTSPRLPHYRWSVSIILWEPWPAPKLKKLLFSLWIFLCFWGHLQDRKITPKNSIHKVRESFGAVALTNFKHPFDLIITKIIIPLYNGISAMVFESRETLWIAERNSTNL